jgi:hypothetical protein
VSDGQHLRASRSAPAGGFAEEETLDLIDVSAIRDEQDDVIVGLHDRIVMSHDDIVPADDAADLCPFGQRDIFDALADYTGAAMVTVDDSFERLGCTAAQRVHLHHISTTYVGQ